MRSSTSCSPSDVDADELSATTIRCRTAMISASRSSKNSRWTNLAGAPTANNRRWTFLASAQHLQKHPEINGNGRRTHSSSSARASRSRHREDVEEESPHEEDAVDDLQAPAGCSKRISNKSKNPNKKRRPMIQTMVDDIQPWLHLRSRWTA